MPAVKNPLNITGPLPQGAVKTPRDQTHTSIATHTPTHHFTCPKIYSHANLSIDMRHYLLMCILHMRTYACPMSCHFIQFTSTHYTVLAHASLHSAYIQVTLLKHLWKYIQRWDKTTMRAGFCFLMVDFTHDTHLTKTFVWKFDLVDLFDCIYFEDIPH